VDHHRLADVLRSGDISIVDGDVHVGIELEVGVRVVDLESVAYCKEALKVDDSKTLDVSNDEIGFVTGVDWWTTAVVFALVDLGVLLVELLGAVTSIVSETHGEGPLEAFFAELDDGIAIFDSTRRYAVNIDLDEAQVRREGRERGCNWSWCHGRRWGWWNRGRRRCRWNDWWRCRWNNW